jgi:hypothetical protein
MKTKIKSSFGARLRGGQDTVVNISSFANYHSPRQEESPEAMSSLINEIILSESEEVAIKENYSMAVDLRQKAFRNNTDSIEKLLSPISGAVVAQYGKGSKEFALISSVIKTMRSTKLVKPPVNPDNTAETKRSISHSNLSYASMTMHFNDLTSTIAEFNGFTSSNSTITVEGLKQICTNITNLNNSVVQNYNALVVSRSKRNALFTELSERLTRIKAYVKAQYGFKSDEYKLIKGAKV